MCIYTEEVLGPVLVVKTFKAEEEAVTLANNTDFGLFGTNQSIEDDI